MVTLVILGWGSENTTPHCLSYSNSEQKATSTNFNFIWRTISLFSIFTPGWQKHEVPGRASRMHVQTFVTMLRIYFFVPLVLFVHIPISCPNHHSFRFRCDFEVQSRPVCPVWFWQWMQALYLQYRFKACPGVAFESQKLRMHGSWQCRLFGSSFMFVYVKIGEITLYAMGQTWELIYRGYWQSGYVGTRIFHAGMSMCAQIIRIMDSITPISCKPGIFVTPMCNSSPL